MSPANDQVQKIQIQDLAKQALKELMLEINPQAQWTNRADKLAESFIQMMNNLGKKGEGGAAEKGPN